MKRGGEMLEARAAALVQRVEQLPLEACHAVDLLRLVDARGQQLVGFLQPVSNRKSGLVRL